MATIFGNEYRCASFNSSLNGVTLSGDLRINKDNKLESFGGSFVAGEEHVGNVSSFLDGPMEGEREMKLNYNNIDLDYQPDIFTLVRNVLFDIENEFQLSKGDSELNRQ